MPRGERLTEVELVEDDDVDLTPRHVPAPGGPDDADPARAGQRPRRTWREWRRHGRWVVPVAVAAVGLLATQTLLDSRAAAVDARIAALPGAIVNVGAELTALWTPTDDERWYPVAFVGGTGVGPTVLDDGSPAVLARDLSTGQEVWSVAIAPAVPELLRSDTWGVSSCLPPPAELADPGRAPETLVCFTADAFRTAGPAEEQRMPSPAWARLVVVDLHDGTIRSQADVPPAWSAATLGDVTALAWLDDERHVVVAGVDTVTGEERWRYRSPDDEPDDDSAGWLSVSEAGGHAVVFTGAGQTYALSATGERRDDLALDQTWSGMGRLVARTDLGRNRVVRAGLPDLEVLGTLSTRVLDDGGVPGLEVSSAGGTVWGWDGRTGRQLWETELTEVVVPSGTPATVADGRVHLPTSAGTVALDARTGEVVWSYTTPVTTGQIEVMCDGPHIVLVVADPSASGPPSLDVLDRRTGTLVRTVAVPDDLQWLTRLGPRLLGYSEESAVVLG